MLVGLSQTLFFILGCRAKLAAFLRMPTAVHLLLALLGYLTVWACILAKDRASAFYRHTGLSIFATYLVAAYLLPAHSIPTNSSLLHRAVAARQAVHRLQRCTALDAQFREWWFHKAAAQQYHCAFIMLLCYVCITLDSNCYQGLGVYGVVFMLISMAIRSSLSFPGAMQVAPLLVGGMLAVFGLGLLIDPSAWLPHGWYGSELKLIFCYPPVNQSAVNPFEVDILAVLYAPIQLSLGLLIATVALGLAHWHRGIIAAAVCLQACVVKALASDRTCHCGIALALSPGAEVCVTGGLLAHVAGWLVVDAHVKAPAQHYFWLEQHVPAYEGEMASGAVRSVDREREKPAGHADAIVGAQGRTCAVCLVEHSTHAFYPCGHKCVCEQCCEQMMHPKRAWRAVCPICREAAFTSLRIFDA